MATGLQTGINAALASLRGLAGETVTYSRGARSITVTAIRGSSRIETEDDQGASIRSRATDWLIEAAALIMPRPARAVETETIQPDRGDRITTAGGEVWEVQAVAGDKPARPSDPAGTHIRIHARRLNP